MTDSGCTFCRIASGDPWDQVFYADDDTVAFLDLAPATPGHALVIPRHHAVDIFSISEGDYLAVSKAVHLVARRLEDRLRPDGLSVFQSNRTAGWQDTFHFHVHVVPRYEGDQLITPWTATTEDPDEVSRLAATLR
ncbi:MAG: HIT domain-containing protein [Microlunatus sp.]|nr:HIT domain-containing protein [Microlunatus sp.]